MAENLVRPLPAVLESLLLYASRNKNNSKYNVKSNQSNFFKPHISSNGAGCPAPFFAADRAFVLPSPQPSLPPNYTLSARRPLRR